MSTKTITAREAARLRHPIGGADAQALEGALAITERERDAARDRVAELEAELSKVHATWSLDTARIQELEAGLKTLLHSHDGMHTEDCNAYGAQDEDVQSDQASADPYCVCGATELRRKSRAILKGDGDSVPEAKTITGEEFDRDPKAVYEAAQRAPVTVLDSQGRPSMTVVTPTEELPDCDYLDPTRCTSSKCPRHGMPGERASEARTPLPDGASMWIEGGARTNEAKPAEPSLTDRVSKLEGYVTMFQRRIDEIVDRLYALEASPTGSTSND